VAAKDDQLAGFDLSNSALWGYMTRLSEAEILGPGEILVDVALAGHGTTPGALVVTDKRVLHFHSSPFTRNDDLLEIPLSQITTIETSEERSPIRKRGVLLIRTGDLATSYETRLDQIDGGARRAEELCAAILRERDLSERDK